MSRRADQSRSRNEPASDRPVGMFALFGLALLVARFVLPAESAHLGETLWLVPLWLGIGIVWTLVRQRFALPSSPVDRGDWAVLLLAGGHVLAGLLTDGNRRAALNGVTEWIGVAAAVLLLRRWLADERRWQQFLAVVATAGVVLAGLGLWQYAVAYPALRADVEELGRLEELRRTSPLSEPEAARLRQLRIELGQLASESDPNLRFALRQRLMRSTEPLACFALTNTLAGVLAVALLLLLGALSIVLSDRRHLGDTRGSSQRSPSSGLRPPSPHSVAVMTQGERIVGSRAQSLSWMRIARVVGPAVLVGFCLLLTKSRTGWAGFCAGGAVWGIVVLRGSPSTGRVIQVAAIGLLSVSVLVAAAWLAGALDLLVVLESSKSLKYRFEYWTGAWGVIRDHWLLGVGPGNFRQNYLRHKVPGSSEEILDPHNLFLDAWASGGLLALLGLLLAVVLAFARWRRMARSSGPPGSPPGVDRMVLLSGMAGIALVWLKLGLVDLHWDARLLALMAGWLASALVLPALRIGAAPQIAAGIALGVHLLGAGGMSMPLVSTLLLLLGLGPALTPVGEPAPAAMRRANVRTLATSAVLAGMLVLVLQQAVIPSLLANFNMNAAMSVMRERGDAGTARRLLENAIAADPLDPQPHVFLGQLSFDASQTRRGNVAELAAAAISALDEAIRLDPENAKTYWLQAQWKLARLSSRGDTAMQLDAAATAEAAAVRDPQNAEVLATLAEASAGVRPAEARSMAARALEIDALNLKLGHYDRLLSDDQRARLRVIADAAGEETESRE